MRGRPWASLLLVLCAAASCTPRALAPDDRTTRRLRDLADEVSRRPDDPTPRYFLAYYQAGANRRQAALQSLDRVLALGDGFLPTAADFAAVADDPHFKALVTKFDGALPRTSVDAPLAFVVPDVKFAPEGIAHDPKSGDFFMGSGSQRRIVRISPNGSVLPFSRDTDDLHAVLGLAVDPGKRRLYAVSTSAFENRGSAPLVNGVVGYDLSTGRKSGAWDVPGAMGLNDVAVHPDGVLLASDSDQGMIWRIDLASGAATALVPPRSIYGINGLAVSGDGEHVYAAHTLGVMRVALRDGARVPLRVPPRQTIAAMDGLYWWNGWLLGVQNVTTPGRVIASRLAADGLGVAEVRTLQSHHHPLFETPTTGAVAEDGFYVLARTQLLLYDPVKGYADETRLKPPAVVRVPLPEP